MNGDRDEASLEELIPTASSFIKKKCFWRTEHKLREQFYQAVASLQCSSEEASDIIPRRLLIQNVYA